jgi:hypothetical protein
MRPACSPGAEMHAEFCARAVAHGVSAEATDALLRGARWCIEDFAARLDDPDHRAGLHIEPISTVTLRH